MPLHSPERLILAGTSLGLVLGGSFALWLHNARLGLELGLTVGLVLGLVLRRPAQR